METIERNSKVTRRVELGPGLEECLKLGGFYEVLKANDVQSSAIDEGGKVQDHICRMLS